jgi:formate dehydrogenase-N alpha subunit
MTNTWQDIKNANVVLVMGGNAAEAHPCGFKWVIEAKIENNAKLVVVDPRFTRTASVADVYAPIRPGTDIAFLSGMIRYLLEKDKIQHAYVRAYTNAGLIIKEGFGFEDGLFTGYQEATRSYDKSSWDYELDENGYAKADETWQHPRCVINMLRKHVARYTPEMVSRICGTPTDKYLQICEIFASTSAPDKALTSLFALGWSQHSVGAQNIRAMAMVQLLLGNIGVAGGGMNALRGHSNIQGLTDVGLLSASMPGYLTLPVDRETGFEDYMKSRLFKPLRPGQTSYWQNYRKFFVSFQKAIYGDAARADNDWAYDWLPKLDVPGYDIIRAFEMMSNGQMNGYICQALGKLKFLVVMDPLDTETSRFWENHGLQNPSDPASIQTEVFQLPTACFAEENGSLVSSARWLQWHWKAADAPGEAKSDIWIMSGIFHRMREMYRKDGGAFPDPILNLTWNYTDPVNPDPPVARSHCVPASCSTALRNCVTTAPRCRAAGSSQAATPKKATRWPGATRPIRASRASHRTGPGRGQPTGAFSIIAPVRTWPARRGTRTSHSLNGTAPAGSGSTCPITRRPPSRPTGSVRSS